MASESSRPLLLPQNRRLRHLKGVFLRNLKLSRPREHTIDDASLNKTPEKLAALRQALREPQLQHSLSSDALNAKIRPGKLRRKSTIWSGQSPGYRQKKLEDVISTGLTDSFFSLHCEGAEEPIYVSEVIEKAMNPSFRFFDLSNYGPSIRRLSAFTIKIWVKRQDFFLLLEQEIDLSSLNFIGSLENLRLPSNFILIHLTDGIYAMDLPSNYPLPKPMPPLSTSSYNSLMRLSRLDDSIQDALSTRELLAAQINAILKETPKNEAPHAQEQSDLASRYISMEKRMLRQSIRRRSELTESLNARRQAIQQGTDAQSQALDEMTDASKKVEQYRNLCHTTTEDIHGQRRRICEELLHIFPIEPTAHSLVFKICGLALPNTSFEDSDEEVVAAALGYVARLVDMLQYYLSVPLPYPVATYGSRSIIRDEISTLADSQRTFPLYTKGTVRFRFDYGVFLLNKDIECLAESQGLKVIDIRHTLPNLKYLLYICSAGTSELPARKAGGIRGLLSGRTPMQSRRGSEDSLHGEMARKGLEHGTGNGLHRNVLLTSLPFAIDSATSLRTRGLRENIVR